jgi:hypothetical protein
MHDIDWFDLDDVDAARARFEELADAPPSAGLDNACVRALERLEWVSTFGDAAGAPDPLAPDVVEVDHRSGVGRGSRIEGRDALVANFVEFRRNLGLRTLRREWLAVRGERYALATVSFVAENDFEIVGIQAYEIDASGRLLRDDLYDVDDLDTAVADLDDRYIAGEGAQHADALAVITMGYQVLAAREYEVMREGLRAEAAPDFAFVDHRRTGWGPLDVDGLVDMQQSYDDVMRTFLVQRVLFGDRALLATVHNRGVDPDGGDVEWVFHAVNASNAEDLVTNIEMWDESDWDAALARFDELSAAPPSDARTLEIENDATRIARLTWDLLPEGRFDELPAASADDARTPEVVNASSRAVDRLWTVAARQRFDDVAAMLAPDVERVDHRPGVALAPITGVDGYLELLRASFGRDEVDRVAVTPLAVRGERLSLTRVLVAIQDFEIAVLVVAELDAEGRIAVVALYDDDDLATAQDELDDRFVAGEATPYAALLATARAYVRATNAKDHATVAALCAPGMTLQDHRLLGALDVTNYLPISAEYADIESSMLVTKYLLGPGALLASAVRRGVDAQGAEALWFDNVVDAFDADARYRRVDFYDAEDWNSALARFDEIAAESPADPATRVPRTPSPECSRAIGGRKITTRTTTGPRASPPT